MGKGKGYFWTGPGVWLAIVGVLALAAWWLWLRGGPEGPSVESEILSGPSKPITSLPAPQLQESGERASLPPGEIGPSGELRRGEMPPPAIDSQVDDAVKMLLVGSGNPEARIEALQQLSRWRLTERGITACLRALRDPDEQVRLAAIQVLNPYPDPRVTELLRRLEVYDSSPDVQTAAREALRRRGS